ncbi:hypothetical protein [Polaromonas sp. YR568]|jgi:hypothetical protein|uniref:hypothetical protein n=1 Tax=Polaromonas sp. YR568 TaxID=1855301 RepID=UPI00313785E6
MKALKSIACSVLLLVIVVVLSVAPAVSQAQSSECVVDRYNNTVCPPAKTLCLLDSSSRQVKCSPVDGGIVTDRYGGLQCGPGRCVLDVRGDPFCSKEPGGAAARGQYGDAVCTGGCVKAQAALCTTLTR